MNALQELKDKKKEFKAKMKAMQADLKKQANDFFVKNISNLFAENPGLESFSWTQYTDYFNDGDVCHFHAHTDEQVQINEMSSQDLWSEQQSLKRDMEKYESNPKVYGGLKKDYDALSEKYEQFDKLQEKVCEFLGILDTEDFQSIWGDHVKVIVTRTEITTEKYTRHD